MTEQYLTDIVVLVTAEVAYSQPHVDPRSFTEVIASLPDPSPHTYFMKASEWKTLSQSLTEADLQPEDQASHLVLAPAREVLKMTGVSDVLAIGRVNQTSALSLVFEKNGHGIIRARGFEEQGDKYGVAFVVYDSSEKGLRRNGFNHNRPLTGGRRIRHRIPNALPAQRTA